MTEINPLVSIIMPAFNAERYIQSAIDSVRQQTITSWELLITNDGSTDGTVDIISSNCAVDPRIVLLNQPNRKQAAARNTALKRARGEWIAFLDADDIWMHDKLEIQLRAGAKADVLYSSGLRLYEETQQTDLYPTLPGFFSGPEMYEILYKSNPVANLSVMVKSNWVGAVGLQDESMELVGCEDWEYWIRLALHGASFLGVEERLFIYRIHSAGTSRNKLRMKMAELHAKARNILPGNRNEIVTTLFVKQVRKFLVSSLLANQLDETKTIIDLMRSKGIGGFGISRALLNLPMSIGKRLVVLSIDPSFTLRSLYKRLFSTQLK